MTKYRGLPAFMVLTVVGWACSGGAETESDEHAENEGASAAEQHYPNLPAEVVFSNERVTAQLLEGEEGVWTGEHGHAGNQLAVILDGGSQTVRRDGAETIVEYEEGQVSWVEAVESHDHMSEDDIEAILITFSDVSGGGMAGAQSYPNAEAGVVFENDAITVQLLTNEPGVWVGEHSHAGNQLVVILDEGTVTYREGDEETVVEYDDGDVFWIDAVEAHDHASTGEKAARAILITLKT